MEPLYIDYRKMKRMNKQAKYELIHMDEFIDELLHGERVCDISLPRLQKRNVLEELNEIEPRISALDVNLDDADETSSESESNSSSSDSESKSSSSDSSSTKSDRRRSHHHHQRPRRHHHDRRRSSSREEKRRHHRSTYVDYDNPKKEDEMPRYKRSPEPIESKKKSKNSSRSRSRSKDRRRKSKRI